MLDDYALLSAWRDGDRTAGDRLFERHFAVVCDFFRNKVSCGVDDLVQRTFVTCIEVQSGFAGRSSFRAYLLGVARKILLRHYRERYRDGSTFAPMVTSVCAIDPSPSAMTAKYQEHAALLEALRRLPLDLQIALELYFWEGLTMREIADVLEVPPGTAASRLRRAKAAVGQTLESNRQAPGGEGWAARLADAAPARR